MNKPQGYDDLKVGGDFTPVELGGHHMVIKGVREEKSKKGRDMIVVAFDFAPNDKQPGYFTDLFEKDIRPDKKWNNAGTKYILTMDSQDDSKVNKDFKRFITAVEKSNSFEVKWDKTFCNQFKGKKVGGVFGVVEEEYDGKVRKKHLLRWFCEDSKADNADIPNPKLLNNTPTTDANGFMELPKGEDGDIPF